MIDSIEAYLGATILICLPLLLIWSVIEGMSPVQYTPMSYDEEVAWLINKHGLSQKEAEEIADLPWR